MRSSAAATPDETGKTLRAAGTGEDSELHLGLPELGAALVVGADAGAACECELAATAEGGPVDGGDHRFAMLGVESLEAGKNGMGLRQEPGGRRRVVE